MSFNVPEVPPSLKPIQHYLKTASEHDARDPVIAYWCRLHALQVGLKLTSKKTPEETKVLIALMDWLEVQKKTHAENEAVTNDVAAQAHLENYALKLFLYADKQDREQNYGKNVVKAFYTAGMIFDVLTEFGELTEEVVQNRKYAKWKAAYIHNCLKNGETPVPGPIPTEGDDDHNFDVGADPSVSGHSGFTEPIHPPGPSASQDLPKPQDFGFVPQNNLLDPNLSDHNTISQLPSVPLTPESNPSGFVAYDPASNPTPAPIQPPISYGDASKVKLTPEQMTKSQKYCKWAISALNYDDVKTAITNLNNALQLLQTGHDPA